ncbi:Uncharacterized protein FWK35_00019143 [Aphis craccivora]|uniref:Uncharacterized protein n=1 Tax=Aphis craccivora TaxID=307492 RepID=A0A6G0YBT2_APHCR|nr:Uncharacterized protein FWK35_00019143 [Aphis craccivora]
MLVQAIKLFKSDEFPLKTFLKKKNNSQFMYALLIRKITYEGSNCIIIIRVTHYRHISREVDVVEIIYNNNYVINLLIQSSPRLWNFIAKFDLTGCLSIDIVFSIYRLETFSHYCIIRCTTVYTAGSILDSERSEECIDFTVIITSRNNAPISNYGGGFRCKSEYPWCIIQVKIFKKIEKNKKKKLRKNGNFYAKPVFDQIDFFYGCNSKNNHSKYLKFSPNCR